VGPRQNSTSVVVQILTKPGATNLAVKTVLNRVTSNFSADATLAIYAKNLLANILFKTNLFSGAINVFVMFGFAVIDNFLLNN
jgi:hypothetical protein